MNHKFKKPRKSRSFCHLCKPHKAWGNSHKRRPIREVKYVRASREEIEMATKIVLSQFGDIIKGLSDK